MQAQHIARRFYLALDQFHGIDLVDIRVLLHGDDGAEPQLTKKGVSLRLAKLPALIAALRDAEVEARRRGLLTDVAASQ